MRATQYIIQYSPPILIKDEPHRILDTADAPSDGIEIGSDDYGSVSVVGGEVQMDSYDLAPADLGETLNPATG